MSLDLVKLEKQTLDFWNKHKIFEKSLNQTQKGEPFIFYDGPPFATGLPHYGHLTASTIKDIIGRYQTMKGRYVDRRWGWDCHGLPIEGEIIKDLNMTPEAAVESLGIKGYNDKCRSIVDRYTKEWQATINRLGRWVNFEGGYKTMDPSYMESVWWVFKQLWDKGLVYQGTKVMPFSTALGTPLANFEAGSNYQDVQDPAITVLFKMQGERVDTTIPTYFAAWTTTPWTLPANMALAVNPNIKYQKILLEDRNIAVILAENAVERYKLVESPVLAVFEGSDLVGSLYEDLSCVETEKGSWPTFACYTRGGPSHRILGDDFVRTETGTGIVHLAPAFGEDDFTVCRKALFETPCPVDDNGKYTEEVVPYYGMHVKDADKQIIRDLKKNNLILRHDTIHHSYPHCPRTDTPLIYKLVPCWYIAVEKLRDKLLATNSQTGWVPEHVRDGRFGSWLKNARDWCVSRNRVWGTPLPIWVNSKSKKTICMGSIEELRKYVKDIPSDFDLHRENVDNLVFKIPGEKGVYRRIPEIFDCWFESGSMPYAQNHYPFSEKPLALPADFIAEGQDQTRGWFYTLMVLSTALFDKPAFKNVVVNGIVLAADGKKMAKRLKNYTDPNILLDQYGADAIRLYIINSGLTKSEDLKFVDKDIPANIKSVLLPWYNAYRFFASYAKIDGWDQSHQELELENPLDIWLLEEMQALIRFVNQELEANRLYTVVPALAKFMDSLTNTYVRLNRRRFWGKGLPTDKCKGYTVYFGVLRNLCYLMAPLTPFLAEYLYQKLRPFGRTKKNNTETVFSMRKPSVHLMEFPKPRKERRSDTLQAVRLLQEIILLGRRKREQAGIEIKTPLSQLKIIHKDEQVLANLYDVESFIKTELNVKTVSYHQDEDNYIKVSAKPNFKTLGSRLKDKMGIYKVFIENLTKDALNLLEDQGYIILAEERFEPLDILVQRLPKEGTQTLSNRHIGIELDCELTPALIREGLARKVISTIQRTRKDNGLRLTDRISIAFQADSELELAIMSHLPHIMAETLCDSIEPSRKDLSHSVEIDGKKLGLKLTKV